MQEQKTVHTTADYKLVRRFQEDAQYCCTVFCYALCLRQFYASANALLHK